MDPEIQIAILAASGVSLASALKWFYSGTVKPDPWPVTVLDPLDDAESAPLCLRCLEFKPDHLCICPHCGSAMDAAARMIPFPSCLTLGDVLRSGTDPARRRKGLLMSLGYILVSWHSFFPAAPFYWWKLARTRPRLPEPGLEEHVSDSKP